MNRKKQLVLAGLAATGMLTNFVPGTFAGTIPMSATAIISSTVTESATKDLDFGTINLSPSASEVTIDASAGPAVPLGTSGGSTTSGGTSGEITVAGAMDLTIEVTYPANCTLTYSGNNITVTNIEANSEGGGAANLIAHTGGTDTLIDVGGVITFVGNEVDGTYGGSMSITLDYN